MNILQHLFLAIMASHAATAADPMGWEMPVRKEDFHIFLLMGQSNMAGYGGIPANDPYQQGDKDPVPGVFMLRGQGTPSKAESSEPMEWRPAAHPLHTGLPSYGFGLGLEFAKEYGKSHPGITIGLIPCAWGGARIDMLNKGTPVFTNAMTRMKFAMKQGIIHGILWHQGESDTVNTVLVDSYDGKLRGLITDVRLESGNPKLPFVIGNLAEFYGVHADHSSRIGRINRLRGILYGVATTVPYCAFASSSGLEDKQGALVHFDRASLIEFGHRYAKVLAEIERQQ